MRGSWFLSTIPRELWDSIPLISKITPESDVQFFQDFDVKMLPWSDSRIWGYPTYTKDRASTKASRTSLADSPLRTQHFGNEFVSQQCAGLEIFFSYQYQATPSQEIQHCWKQFSHWEERLWNGVELIFVAMEASFSISLPIETIVLKYQACKHQDKLFLKHWKVSLH